MVFKDYNSIFHFYKKYASSHGYSVRQRYARPRRGCPKELLYYLKFVCYKEGVKRVSKKSGKPGFHPKANVRASCPAFLKADWNFPPKILALALHIFNLSDFIRLLYLYCLITAQQIKNTGVLNVLALFIYGI